MRPTAIAHQLLDAARSGAPVDQDDIEDALAATGDIPGFTTRELSPQSTLHGRTPNEEIEQ